MSRIYNNTMSLNTQRALNKNTSAQSKVLEKLSSGMAINRAADDAAGLSISQKMRANIKAMERSSKNAQDAISFVQAAEAALDEVSNMLTRAAELAEQKNDGIIAKENEYGGPNVSTDEDLKAVQDEMDQLGDQINCIITYTKFNGVSITKTLKFGIDGSDRSLSVGTNITDPQLDGTKNVKAVTGMVKTINTARSYLGAMQNRVQYAKNNVDANVENLTAAESRIRDTDMAAMMSEFNKYNILTQAATSMLAQANSTPQSVLSLLQ